MSQAESKLSREIMDDLRLEGWFCFKVHGSDTMMTGLPDIVVCVDGFFIGLETKMPHKRNNSSVKQRQVRDEIIAAGGHCSVVCSIYDARKAIREALAARIA